MDALLLVFFSLILFCDQKVRQISVGDFLWIARRKDGVESDNEVTDCESVSDERFEYFFFPIIICNTF